MPRSDEELLAKLHAGLAEAPEGELLAAGEALARVDGCPSLSELADRAATARVYVVALPAGLRLLNANEARKMHWATANNITQGIVDAAIVMTRKAKVPRLERVVISAVLHPNDRRKLDPHNWSPSVKAATDGVVRSGVLSDDDSEHVTDGGITRGAPVKGGQLVLHIRPVDGAL